MLVKDFIGNVIEVAVPINITVDKDDDGVIYIEGWGNRAYSDEGTELKDRDGDVVLPSAYKLDNFKANPVILYQHNRDSVIGKAIDVQILPQGLHIKAAIYRDLDQKAFTAIKSGVVSTFSIGFQATDGFYKEDSDTFYFSAVELLEVSAVTIPAQPQSTFSTVESPCGNGQCMLSIQEVSTKGFDKEVVTIQKDLTVSTKKWSNVNKSDMLASVHETADEAIIKDAYLIVEDVTKRNTFKFPHHEFVAGQLKLSVGGLKSAFAALKGSENFDEAHVEAAKHLMKHFDELVESDLIDSVPDELEDMCLLKETEGTPTMEEELALLKEQLESKTLELNTLQETLKEEDPAVVEPVVTDPVVEGDPVVEEDPITLSEAIAAIKDAVETSEDIEPLMNFYEEFSSVLNTRIETILGDA